MKHIINGVRSMGRMLVFACLVVAGAGTAEAASDLPVKGAAFHVDASDTSTLTIEEEGGVQYVTKWTDADGGARYASQSTASGIYRPYITKDGTLLRPFVDFGPGKYKPATASPYAAALNWSSTDSSIREIFLVYSDHPDCDMSNGSFLLGAKDSYHFHRDANRVLFNNQYASGNLKNGLIQVDGTNVTYDYALPAGFHIIHLRTTGVVTADRFASDRDQCMIGGQRLAEAIVYDAELTDADAALVYRYLEDKWLPLYWVCDIPDQIPCGSALTPELVVSNVTTHAILKKGTDYSVVYSNNVNSGTAYAYVTGLGDFEGHDTYKTFTILPGTFDIAPIPDMDCSTGFGKAPSGLTVTNRYTGVRLIEGTDYIVSATNNDGIGTATAIAIGQGAYAYQHATAPFTITATRLDDDNISVNDPSVRMTIVNGKYVYVFTNGTDTITVKAKRGLVLNDYLLVGGGGGGGNTMGGGGGGGGVLYVTNLIGATISRDATFTVALGAGGTKGGTSQQAGNNGSATTLNFGGSTYSVVGGGGGGGWGATSGKVGGSGGGGAQSAVGGSGTSGLGYAGASGGGNSASGGGGGAGGAGYAAANSRAGNGGPGLTTWITGEARSFGGGGGGGGSNNGFNTYAGGYGGTGGGGNGGKGGGGSAGAAGTGGGGGGGGWTGSNQYGGAGGSGAAILVFSKSDFEVDPIPTQYVVTGGAQPTLVVRDPKTQAALTENTDYTVAFTDNTFPGTAKAIITGRGTYAGKVAYACFTITPVYCVTASAEPTGTGASWSDTMMLTNALKAAAASTVACEVWIAGTAPISIVAQASYAFKKPVAIRGGFAGTESTPAERAAGAKSVLDAAQKYKVLNFSMSAAVELDGLVLTRGYVHDLQASGSGNLTLRDCEFNLCKGYTLYDGNGAGNANRSLGGAGAYLVGSGSATLTVTNCAFRGNVGNGEWAASGVGAWIGGYKTAVFDDTLFATNNFDYGRNGTRAAIMQVVNVPMTFRRCSFRGNYCAGGDLLNLNGSCGGSTFLNCDFSGNKSSGGPLVNMELGGVLQTVAFTNNTFAYNYNGTCACVSMSTGKLFVHNSIFHRNHCGSSSTVGVDIALTAATATGRVDWTFFDGLTSAYRSETADGSLTCENCLTGFDPLFVTSTADFAAISGTSATPLASAFNGTGAQRASYDVHLRSSEGYFDATGGLHKAAGELSSAIDAGDPTDSVGEEKSDYNGARINLGAYGGTAYASLTPYSAPAVEDVTVSFEDAYTQPTVSFTLGGEGVYSASAVVKISTNGTDWCYISSTIAGLTSGSPCSFRVPKYYVSGSKMIASVEIVVAGKTYADESEETAVVGTIPPWSGKGGGANVIHVRPGATGLGDGTSWTDAVQTLAEAMGLLTSSITEIWFAGTNVYTMGPSLYAFNREFAIRGGFTGSENAASERTPGVRSVLDAAYKGRVLKLTLSAPVELDGLVLTRGSIHDLEASGSGNLTLRDCEFNLCAGGTMYDENNAGKANRARGGAGACLTGSGSATLTVTNCAFRGNVASGEWVASGVGAWISGYKSAVFDDTLFVTNSHNKGRSGCFAAIMQVQSVPMTFRRCSFRGNYCAGGDLLNLNGNCGGSIFVNCDFSGNQSSGGPLVQFSLGTTAQTVAFTNDTFAYNYNGGSAAVVANTGYVTVHNSIFHRNYSSTSSTKPVDLYLAAATATGRVDWTAFDTISSDYQASSAEGALTLANCSSGTDPLFVTPTETFTALIGSTAAPRLGSFSVASAKLANLDVHLLSSEGYWMNDGATNTAEGVLSPFIDAGDSDDDVGEERPYYNGNRINLGAYGGTARASFTPYCAPAVTDVKVTFENAYSQPTVSFVCGGAGVYSATAVVKVTTNETDWCYVSSDILGLASSTTNSYRVPKYYVAGDTLRARIEMVVAGKTYADESEEVTVQGELPLWSGKSGGANVIHVRPGATGLGDGTSWTDAVQTLAEAVGLLNSSITEIWFAGTNVYASAPSSYAFTRTIAIRGGFRGWENDAAERVPGVRSVLDAAYKGRVLKFTLSAPVELDGLILTRGSIHDLEASGSGNLTLRDCEFNLCAGGTMYDGNNSGYANRWQGGAGACLTGSGSATLTVTNCAFRGNEAGGEWVASGVGAWIGGYKAATFDDTLFVTNSHNSGRQGLFAGVMQVQSVPVTMRRCEFRGNYSAGGDFVNLNGNCNGSVFENCAIVGNYTSGSRFFEASLGGVAQTVDFINCTFAYNYVATGAVLHDGTGVMSVHNSIFHRNHCSTSSTRGADIHLAANTATGSVDWTYFDGLTSAYYSETASGSLTLSDCATGYDPLFVTSTADFATITGTGDKPATSKFGGSWDQRVAFDVHLRSSEGYFDATGGLHKAEGELSSAIDAGDPSDDVGAESPKYNGNCINLGAYGGTKYASLTPYCEPAVEDVAVSFVNEYTQPTVSFKLGGVGVYSAETVVKVYTNGVMCYVSASIKGCTSGETKSFVVPKYYRAGDTIKARVEITVKGLVYNGESAEETVEGTIPPWSGKGGGASVVHVRPGATGLGDGTSWTDAVDTLADAVALITDDISEIWFAGSNIYSSAVSIYAFKRPIAIRGGFTGSENLASERQVGRKSLLDAAYTGRVLNFTLSAPVELDGLILTRGSIHDLEASGSGNLTLRDCEFNLCAGGTMYDGNNSGYANRARGGAGACLTGSGSATLTVTNCAFRGNVASGEWVASGVGAWIGGYKSAIFDDTLFVTNSHNKGRSGCFAAIMQVQSVPVTFRRCAFRGNYCAGGDFINLNGNCGCSTFVNCEFTGNQSSGGPLVQFSLGTVAQTVAFTNDTFAYNYNGGSAAVVANTGYVTVHNTIFHRNYSSTSSTKPVDLYLAAATATGRVDWTAFDAITNTYQSAVAEGSLTIANCIANQDPLFVTTTESIETLVGSAAAPRLGSFSVAMAKLADLNVHLRGRVGYVDKNTDKIMRYRGKSSPAIDAGDPESDYAGEPDTFDGSNGRRVNLGAYGNTPYATMTPVGGAFLRIR